MKFKFGIGVMSKNIVDACINCANNLEFNIILIPSRRQVEFNGGYANDWTTKEFADYVKSQSYRILLERDHAGPNQGNSSDDGKESLYHDCFNLDIIHIDPWKISKTFEEGCLYTKEYIEYCYRINPRIQYEVGTEESIFKYESYNLEELLNYLSTSLHPKIFEQIQYAVIQSGTSLKENNNTGQYDTKRLVKMIEVCKNRGILSKEHNGDYLSTSVIKEKFKLGLNCINIAPELGQIESQAYLDEIKNTNLLDEYFNICYSSNRWQKWVDSSFDPFNNKEKLINICGHYVLSNKEFLSKVKHVINKDMDSIIKAKLIQKLIEWHE